MFHVEPYNTVFSVSLKMLNDSFDKLENPKLTKDPSKNLFNVHKMYTTDNEAVLHEGQI